MAVITSLLRKRLRRSLFKITARHGYLPDYKVDANSIKRQKDEVVKKRLRQPRADMHCAFQKKKKLLEAHLFHGVIIDLMSGACHHCFGNGHARRSLVQHPFYPKVQITGLCLPNGIYSTRQPFGAQANSSARLRVVHFFKCRQVELLLPHRDGKYNAAPYSKHRQNKEIEHESLPFLIIPRARSSGVQPFKQ